MKTRTKRYKKSDRPQQIAFLRIHREDQPSLPMSLSSSFLAAGL